MFRIHESDETNDSNGDDLNGVSPIRIRINSSGNNVHDDASASLNIGPSGVPRTAEQTLPSGRPSIFALRSSPY